ncbi:hypothetical protein [Tianweitania sediminis]|uniref:Uncharacterized protein n=1 Tax=Tianweitania sediminis TaxID=1502156 RepID=A0A8J7RKZ0_9HYPH|nr:hypothetical protein [Tianweitania sediminis]MBP0439116.1 hypothetical protein [Tianweitania sediminis]
MSSSENVDLVACKCPTVSLTVKGSVGDGYVVELLLDPDQAEDFGIEPGLIFRFDPHMKEVRGAFKSGASFLHSKDMELPFGEPGGITDFERCKRDPLPFVSDMVEDALATARYQADVAAGRLRALVIVRPDGEIAFGVGNLPSDLDASTAQQFLEMTFWEDNWEQRYKRTVVRTVGSREDADLIAYDVPNNFDGATERDVIEAGGILLSAFNVVERAA